MIIFALAITIILSVTVFIPEIQNRSLASSSKINENNLHNANPDFSNTLIANSDSPIIIGEPIMRRTSLNFTGVGNAEFVSYEDFPIYSKQLSLHMGDLKIANKPVDAWMKFIDNGESSHNNTGIILRLAGAVKPIIKNNFNSTIYVVDVHDNQISNASSLPIVKNDIIDEVAIIKENIPIRFKNEILVQANFISPHIFGLVYDGDNNRIVNQNASRKDPSFNLEINIQPIGLMHDGNITKLPEWLKIETLNLPISLTENVPGYYGILVSTSNAPLGSYEIGFRETVNNRVFIETMTITIIKDTS